MILETVKTPDDLTPLTYAQLDTLSNEIRQFLITSVSKTGGHLGPNLGVVELTLALHRTFHSPTDTIIFDTGHQTYVHKLLTGRIDQFASLRQYNGMSGYPSRDESVHDAIENSHASTGLSYALAYAIAKKRQGKSGKTICVVGDGSLTGGLSYEALNNIGQLKPEMIIVLNDNGRSYAPTIGGIADHLGALRLSPTYEAAKEATENVLLNIPLIGKPAYGTARRVKNSLKQLVASTSLFETLGIKYGGPIDGHSIRDLEKAFKDASCYPGPVVIHVVTDKGRGYMPAVEDETDKFHGVPAFDPASGIIARKAPAWTDLFGEALCEAAEKDRRIVAITAAMASSTGLLSFAERFPDRFFDVGIAEQHAVTFAAGLALQGMKPVVCIYSTFLQRAFDQLICDVALHKAPVLFILDRAGITGDDGSSHHGMFDLAYLRCIPEMTVAAPSTPDEMRRLLATGLRHSAPFALRFPRGAAPGHGTAPLRPVTIGQSITRRHGKDVLIIALGKMAETANDAAAQLAANGLSATVVDARFVKPLDPALVDYARTHSYVVTVEDGTLSGGFGDAVASQLADAHVTTNLLRLGIPDMFIPHGAQNTLLASLGLDSTGIASSILSLVAPHHIART